MNSLLRMLVAARGLILACTLALAIAGSGLDRGIPASLASVHSAAAGVARVIAGDASTPLNVTPRPEGAVPADHGVQPQQLQSYEAWSLYELCGQPGYSTMTACRR